MARATQAGSSPEGHFQPRAETAAATAKGRASGPGISKGPDEPAASDAAYIPAPKIMATAAAKNALGATEDIPALRVAVVDDDPSFQRSVGRLLRLAGFSVETFDSGQDFLASLATQTPECLVLDVHMPGMSGLELHAHLVQLGSPIPVIFVTAYETPQTLQYAHQSGSTLLLKPVTPPSLLLQAIRTAVQSPQASLGPMEGQGWQPQTGSTVRGCDRSHLQPGD